MRRRIFGVSVGWLGISIVADGVPALLLPHQLLAAGRDDAATLGITTAVAIALAMAVQPVAGRWSDAVGRWPVIGLGVVVASIGMALVLVPVTAVPGTVVALIGVSIAQAGHQPLVPDVVEPSWRGRAAGAKGVFDVGGAFLGFAVLAALLGEGAAPGAVLLLLAAIALPFLVAYRLLPHPTPPRTQVGPPLAAFRIDLSAHRPLAGIVLARFLVLTGVYVVGRFLVFFVADRFRLGADAAAAQAGAALAVLALVSIAASLPSGWIADRAGRRRLMLAGGAAVALGIALLPAVGSLVTLLLCGALVALGSAAFSAGSWARLTDLTPREDAGRQLGLANIGTAGAAAAAGLFGVLIDAGNGMASGFGYALAFGVAAACALAGGLVAWRLAGPPLPVPSSSSPAPEVPR